VSYQLRVNPIDCAAHGLCAELLPERVTLDDWGYPIVDAAPVDEDLVAHARRAVAACPVFALKLELVSETGRQRANRLRRPSPNPRLA
jgi:ferredoxin